MPKRAVFEIFRQELSLDVSVGDHILLVVEQSSLESQSKGCAKAPMLTVLEVEELREALLVDLWVHSHFSVLAHPGTRKRFFVVQQKGHSTRRGLVFYVVLQRLRTIKRTS